MLEDRPWQVVAKLSISHGKEATLECPCGFFSDPKKECSCSSSAVTRYQKRVSGPLLDRIDVFVEVPPVEYEDLVDEAPAQDSDLVPGPWRGYQKTCPPRNPTVNTQAIRYSRPTAFRGKKNRPADTTPAMAQKIQGSLRMIYVYGSPAVLHPMSQL